MENKTVSLHSTISSIYDEKVTLKIILKQDRLSITCVTNVFPRCPVY